MLLLEKKQFGAAVCSVEVARWDTRPPLVESDEDLLVASEYEGRCRVCDLDIKKCMKTLGLPTEEGVIALRSAANRMDPCWNFPHEELADLFMHATVTEALLVALEHMQMDYVTVGRTGLSKFRKNVISFPQELGRFVERHGLLGRYKQGDRVNSRRGPGDGGPDREARRARDNDADRQICAEDREGYLVYPATVTRVEGVRHVYVEYDCKKGEEYVEAV